MCKIDRLFQEFITCDRRVRAGKIELACVITVGASALSDDDIAKIDLVGDRARAADSYDVFDVVKIEKFVRINTDRRYAHARRHDGHDFAVVHTCISVNAAHAVYEYGVFQKVFRNEFRAKGIARHKDGFCEIVDICTVV